MTDREPNPVVVAVGHDSADSAIAFAADEAIRAGCGLHLVHVVQPLAQGPETGLITGTDLERAGRQALNGALEHARDLVPDTVLVSGELGAGGVAPTLVEMAAGARMIVLERRDLSPRRRVLNRSVSSGVAARACVPVVSVPASWEPEDGRQDAATLTTVTVGVDVPARAELVLRAGAAEARSRGAVLHVLHTWSFPWAYDDIMLNPAETQEWAARATSEIQAAIDALGDDVAGVPVRIETRHAQAVDALVGASEESEVLVIGRHDPLVPIGSHLGPIARAVLRGARCPVLLASPRPGHGWKRHADHGSVASPQRA